MSTYKGGYVINTKVDRPEEAASEHAGPDGSGSARATLDARLAGPAKSSAGISAQVDTTGVGINQTDSLKRTHSSW